MAVKLEDILELRMKIENDRKKLEEQERALLILEQMLNEQFPQPQPVAPAPETSTLGAQSSLIKLEELSVANVQERRTLADDVWDVAQRFGEQEFTVPHVEAVLKQLGREINAKAPRARIAMVLGTLEERGQVIRTFKGTGSVPHRFKVAPKKNRENLSGANTEALDLV